MSRTKLENRKLPDYTRAEEAVNMATHALGGLFGIVALVLCVVTAARHHNPWGIVGGAIYGSTMIFLYTMSSIYHGLFHIRAKLVFQVIDHCSIYALISGTYMPILFTGIRKYSITAFIIIFSIVVVGTAVGVVFTAVDFHKYAVISYAAYFIIGWSALFALRIIYKAFNLEFVIWLVAGGAVYTMGMIFFAIGIKRKFFHSIFHLFILGGSIIQFIGIIKFCM